MPIKCVIDVKITLINAISNHSAPSQVSHNREGVLLQLALPRQVLTSIPFLIDERFYEGANLL